jgi:putative ABC transport system permease protein
MGVLWSKVRFDLFRHKGRTFLAVFSIAVGVFAIGAIFGMVDQMLSGMDEAHQAVNPSHVNMILRIPIDQQTIDELIEIPGVEDIDPLNQLSVRYKAEPGDEWEIGTLMMRTDYEQQILDQIALKEGEWPAEGKFAVERLSSQEWGFDLGSEVIFDVAGEETSYPIVGKIRHPFVQPPAFGGQAHFFTDAQGMAEFGIPEGRFMQLLVRVDDYSLERSKEIAAEIRSRLAEKGYGVVVTLYQDPEKHWGRSFVEGVYVVLRAMAVVSLFISVVLVLNTFNALITQQTDQIGIIKSIGGRRRVLLGVYLSGALFYGLLALLIALPLSSIMAWMTSRWFLNLFNIDYQVFQFSWRAILLQVACAIAAPVLAAFWPVWRGANMHVREAIATYGLGADFGAGMLDRLVERFSLFFLPSPYAISLGNLFRRKGRLILTLLVLIVAGVTFLVVMTLISSTQATMDNEMSRRGYDLRLGFMREQDIEKITSILVEEDIQDQEVWYGRNVTLLQEGERLEDSAGLGAQLIGLPTETKMLRPLIVAGRWLQEGDNQAIVISQETAEKNGLEVGDRVILDLGDLGREEWDIVGIYGVVYGGGFVVEPVYAPLEAVAIATNQEGKGTQVYISSTDKDLASVQELMDRLKDRFEDEGVRIDFYTTSVKEEERIFADNQFSSVINVLLNLAMLMAIVGGIGLMGALGISVMERRREIGVMRSVGARSRTLLGIYIMEGTLQGLLSWLFAVPLSFFLAQPMARLLGQTMLDLDLDYVYNWQAVLAWLLIVLVISSLMSMGPARSAARMSVRENLAYS